LNGYFQGNRLLPPTRLGSLGQAQYLCYARYKNGELYNFQALTIQMGHEQRDNIRDYWSRDK
jgi:hypothetical protein